MKKLILSLVVTAFAVASQAGEGQACADKKACCPSKAKLEAKAQCSAGSKEAKACPLAGKKEVKEASAKQQLQSPKAVASVK